MTGPCVVWLNGLLDNEDSVRLSPFDHGLLTGDGVFETIRVTQGVPFAWRRHMERLVYSASGLGLPVPDATLLRSAVDAVLAANHVDEGRMRITITGGPSPLGSKRGPGPPTVLVAANPPNQSAEYIAVAVAPWPRNERGALSGLKTISYGENVRALAFAREQGAEEAILANTVGNLCEGTGTNIFVARDNVLLTPPASAGCLLGVTRGLVLELAAATGITVREEDVVITQLATATEAFLTSTTRRIQPVESVDGAALPTCPGPITTALARAFDELESRTLDP
jgi:branched-chain amino acid aminotransferase